MAKKAKKAKKKSPAKRKTVKKAVKKAARKAAGKKPKKAPAKVKQAGKSKKKTVAKKKPSKPARKKGLGRPRLPGDSQVDQVFASDKGAREVCEFLRVSTLKELEKFEPDEIIQRLTSPVIQTVGRIRKVLAIANRSLAGDVDFAVEFRERYPRR